MILIWKAINKQLSSWKFNTLIVCVMSSLRSKRLRGVWEQRKTEERDFQYFDCAENGARAKKWKMGVAL